MRHTGWEWTGFLLILGLIILEVGCGSSGNAGNGGIDPTPKPTPFTVSVSPQQSTIDASKQVQFMATPSGGSGGTTTYTWSMNPDLGSLSATSGSSTTYSAPNTVAAQETVTVSVTAKNGSDSASNTATITINPVTSTLRTITGFTVSDVECSGACGAAVIIHGTNFTANDVVNVNPGMNLSVQFVDNQTMQMNIGLDDNGADWNPGTFAITICASDGTQCSQPGYLIFGGAGGNLGGVDGSEEFRLDPGSDQILKFKLTDGSADGAITDSQNPKLLWGFSFAVDNTAHI